MAGKRGAKRKKIAQAEAEYERAKKTSAPGEGSRFEALSNLLKAKGAKDPDALAASIGRRKYGKRRFQSMAARGRRGG